MKHTQKLWGLGVALLLSFVSGAIASEPSIDLDRLLKCIAHVETGERDGIVGKRGEISRFQMKPSVLRQWLAPFPGVRLTHEQIARQHITWLHGLTSREKGMRQEWLIAFCWKEGWEAWRGKRLGSHKRRVAEDYANRVSALYADPTFN